jgi:hypothetical protein
MKKNMILFTSLITLSLFEFSCRKEKLNVYNWSYYTPPSVIEKFEKEYNVRVILDEYASNEEMYTKLRTGGTGYDIVFPSQDYVEIMIRQGMFEKIDKSLIPNLKNIDPAILKKTLLLILSRMEENPLLLSVVLTYLISKKPAQPGKRVRRRTIRLRHILATSVIEGIKSGQLKKIDVGSTNDLLYSLLEAAIFHLTILKQESAAEQKKAAETLVDSICS